MVNTFRFWFVLILVALGLVAWYVVEKAIERPAPHEQIKLGGDFELLDQNGQLRSNKEFYGKFMMVYFGYRHCPDICPTALTTMTETLNMLGAKANHIQPIFITIDPERDTVPELADYIQNFHDNFIALTGNAEQIEQVAHEYRVFSQKIPQNEGDYSMDHSSIIYIMDRQGNFVSHFSHSTPSEEITKALRKIL